MRSRQHARSTQSAVDSWLARLWEDPRGRHHLQRAMHELGQAIAATLEMGYHVSALAPTRTSPSLHQSLQVLARQWRHLMVPPDDHAVIQTIIAQLRREAQALRPRKDRASQYQRQAIAAVLLILQKRMASTKGKS